VWDLKHRFIYANEALLTTWGKTREEAIGKTCLGLGFSHPWKTTPADRPRAPKAPGITIER
jgi:PAS domain-containing protein